MAEKPVRSWVNLTRGHAVKATTSARVEDFVLALGDVVGHQSVLSASRMSQVTVGFVDTLAKAETLVKTGIVIDGETLAVSPLSSPAKRVTVSNAPPYLEDEMLSQVLARYGEIVSPFEKIPIRSSSPLVKHVKSFRRSVQMIVPDNGELELTLSFRRFDIDHNVYVTTGKMRCFRCGETSHLVRKCPQDRPKTNKSVVTLAEARGESAGEMKEAVGAAVEELVEQVQQEETRPQPVTHSDVTEDRIPCEESMETVERVAEQESTCRRKVPAKRKAKHQEPSEEPTCSETPVEKVEHQAPEKRKSRRRRRRSAAESDSDSDPPIPEYSVEDIKLFLKVTKNHRGVEIFDYFTDEMIFVQKCKDLMAKNLFEDTEVFRLKKLCKKVTDRLRTGDG